MLITLARKPLMGSVVQNALTHGCGALNINASRISGLKPNVKNIPFEAWRKTEGRDDRQNPCQTYNQAQGRWPANVLVTPTAADGMDVQSGFLHARGNVTPTKQQNSNGVTGWGANRPDGPINPSDAGGASRFFKKVGADPC